MSAIAILNVMRRSNRFAIVTPNVLATLIVTASGNPTSIVTSRGIASLTRIDCIRLDWNGLAE
jgi:hypothetical protein